MDFFSSVPLVDPKNCPDNEDHNRLARQVNQRLTRSGPDCLWRIFYYADGIFTGMRNSATQHMPLGVNPPEDEWWKIYMTIEYPVAATGNGNWPLSLAGRTQGANVMNPLNAFIFGRVTSENRFLEKQGPWAEGNTFDGLVASSRAILSNKQYWEDSYMQRGAIAINAEFNHYISLAQSRTEPWQGYSVFGAGRRIKAKYLPNPEDPAFLSTSLTSAGVSSDRYFEEYASTHVYMRYPPSLQYGKFIKYGRGVVPADGVLKRKNATKDLLQWGLWAYVYYFKGSEAQRSLFCDKKPWFTKVVDYNTTENYQFSLGGTYKQDRDGPLNICKVGFDFYKYFTRQNVFAPALGLPTKFKSSEGMVAHEGYYELDGIGNMRVEPYRVSFTYTIKHNQTNSNQGAGTTAYCERPLVYNTDTIASKYNKELNTSLSVNKHKRNVSPYGKRIGFTKSELSTYTTKKRGLFVCSYDNHKSSRAGRNYLNFDSTSGRGTSQYIKSCLAGYYLETEAIEDKNCVFKFRIWSGSKIVHETIINNKYSYRVNRRGIGDAAYVFNKMFYFKEGLVPNGKAHKFRFEIVPVQNNVEYAGGDREIKKHIALGNPWTSTIKSTHRLILDPTYIAPGDSNPTLDRDAGIWPSVVAYGMGKSGDGLRVFANENSHIKNQAFAGNFSTGEMVRVKCLKWEAPKKASEFYNDSMTPEQIETGKANYVTYLTSLPAEGKPTTTIFLNFGNPLFVRKNGDKLYFSKRQDDRLTAGSLVLSAHGDAGVGGDAVKKVLDNDVSASDGMENIHKELLMEKKSRSEFEVIVVEKLDPPTNIFKVKVDLAILQKRKPTFQDAYALLRVATAKQNRRNMVSNIIMGDQAGVGMVGHHFSESNRVFRNYFKYGSAMNLYGSSAVPALSQYVSASPIYESMRKFISSFMRFVDRQQLVNYKVEGGKGILYFKRFAWGLSKRYKATILRNMEPSIDPVGWFHEDDSDPNEPGHSKFTPIKKGKRYRVAATRGTGVYYEGRPYGINSPHGTLFTGNEKDHLDSVTVRNPKAEGAFEIEGIDLANGKTGDALQNVTNDWVMFMTSAHYHKANTNIYKPSVYNDIMGFLNNRCHHRSREYENSLGDKYDMIRSELLRIPTSPRNTPGRLHTFLSKSSPNFNYIFNTNDPAQGNVELYSETGDGRADYMKSCTAVTTRPYKVISTRIVNNAGNTNGWNPSSRDINGRTPFDIVKVTLDRPLRGTGRLSVGSRGWIGVQRALLKKEPYRTDENAIIEYLHHINGNYACKRNMIGDYGSATEVIEGDGYRPFGACYPRFYFLKLIPRVPNGALLDTEPYAQMDFYFRAMSNGFVNPYPLNLDLYSQLGQTTSLNWKFTEIASRSSEEDPTMFDYIDPRDITS